VTGWPEALSPPRRFVSSSTHKASAEIGVKDLLEYLARGLVEHPDQVSVTQVEEDDGSIVLELSVNDDDYGSVIGRGGRTAAALRTVIKAAAVKEKRRVFVDIVDS
jgi:uncharacterized protein